MRFLQVASRYQVQLGWLRVIADAVGDDRKNIEEVAQILLGCREQFNGWWEDAGHAPPARGIAQPATANRAARIGATYGIHDADNQGALTPLGHVLRMEGPWRGLESPFAWQGSVRWLGLWIVFSVSGDVLLSVLRSWPEGGLESDRAADFMADVLRHMARSTNGESRKMLRNQANRATGELRFARNFLIYPYLEPLRDLGYLETHGRAGGYRLTPAGARLAAVLGDDRNADEWLDDGLHRAFLIAEGESEPQPATADVLPEILENLPTSLLRIPGQIPLSIALLLAQCRLFASRKSFDVRHGTAMLRSVSQRSDGQVRLDGETLCWTTAALQADIWSDTGTLGAAPASAPTHSAPTPPPSATADGGSSLQGNARADVVNEAVEKVQKSEPVETLGDVFSLRWLQGVAVQLQSQTPDRLLQWGGPRAALKRLHDILLAGTEIEAADAMPLQQALDRLAPLDGEPLLRRVVERWGPAVADVALRATLERAERATEGLSTALRARVLDGVHSKTDWECTWVATMALLQDALVVDHRDPTYLLNVLGQLRETVSTNAAVVGFLDELMRPPQPFVYLQQVAGALPSPPPTDGVSVVVLPGVMPHSQIWVHVQARDPVEALRCGRERASHVAAVLSHVRRGNKPAVLSESLSPPNATPCAVPVGLTLPRPAPTDMALSSMTWARPVSGEGDQARLSAVLHALSMDVPSWEIWPAIAQVTADPLLVLPAASALLFARSWLVMAVRQAEAALLDVTIADPSPARLSMLERWLGEDAGAVLEQRRALPSALRAVHPLSLPPQHSHTTIRRLQEEGAVLMAGLDGEAEQRWPWAVSELQQARLALAEPRRLSVLAERQRAAVWSLLTATRTMAAAPVWRRHDSAVHRVTLSQTLDPIVEGAAAAVAAGSALDLHWGAVLDRCDDLMSLSGVAQMDRILEILDD